MKLRIVYLLVAAALMLPLASAANTYDIGVSGRCEDASPDTDGGSAEVSAVDNGNGVTPTVTPVNDPTGIPGALAAFLAPDDVNDPLAIYEGHACSDSASDDHLEAHAVVGTAKVQVCWNGAAHVTPGTDSSPACSLRA
jgi:hypothetical protein